MRFAHGADSGEQKHQLYIDRNHLARWRRCRIGIGLWSGAESTWASTRKWRPANYLPTCTGLPFPARLREASIARNHVGREVKDAEAAFASRLVGAPQSANPHR